MKPPSDPEERDALAGEYVLGTLDADTQHALEQALPVDAAWRAAVFAWQDRLLPLSARAESVLPSAGLWPRIEGALHDATAPAPPRPRPAAQRPDAWWQGLWAWRALAGAAVAVALVLGTLLFVAERPEERYLAVLQSPDSKATGWVVEVSAGGTLRLVPVGAPAAVPAGRAWQFWTKPEGASGPTSLGLVNAGQTLQLPASQLPGVGARQLFEITLEPEGGSPIGRPTGPILYVGTTVRL